jgi:hypothetical protein
LEAPAFSREPKDSVSGEDPERSSDELFECINQPAMTNGSQTLHIFESDSTDKNDAKDKKLRAWGMQRQTARSAGLSHLHSPQAFSSIEIRAII